MNKPMMGIGIFICVLSYRPNMNGLYRKTNNMDTEYRRIQFPWCCWCL